MRGEQNWLGESLPGNCKQLSWEDVIDSTPRDKHASRGQGEMLSASVMTSLLCVSEMCQKHTSSEPETDRLSTRKLSGKVYQGLQVEFLSALQSKSLAMDRQASCRARQESGCWIT